VQPPKRGFRWCGIDPGPCISKDYFCDKRFNCKGEAESALTTTHDELSCRYIEDDSKSASSSKDDNGKINAVDSSDKKDDLEGRKDLNSVTALDPNALNTISWVLIGICTFLGLLLILILAIGCTRNTFCRRPRSPDSAAECFQHERNLADLSANRLETEPNVYLPLDTFRQATEFRGQADSVEEALVPQAAPAPPLPSSRGEEPPPSYDSLFPDPDAADEPSRASSVNE